MAQFTCLSCGKSFQAKPSARRKYCSFECYQQTRLNITVCIVCGKKFKSRASSNRKYCSKRCSGIANRNKVTLICERCGTPFNVPAYLSNKDNPRHRRYCSHSCAQGARVIVACQHCGKEFSSKKVENRKYCSVICYRKSVTGKPQGRRTEYVTVRCQFCRKQYEITKAAFESGQNKFCSRSCATQNLNKTRWQDIEHVTVNCQTCGKPITMTRSRYEQGGKNKYCNTECVTIARKGESAEYVDMECLICGKPIHILKSRRDRGDGHYCSLKCSSKAKEKPKVECICQWCGKAFFVLESYIAGYQGAGTYCSAQCRGCATAAQISTISPTSIEQALIEELDARSIPYEFQYPLESWVLDFAFPAYKLAVEADGVYWHSLDNVIEKDARKDADLHAQGWTILRFTGDQIRESPAACVDEIVKVLK